ncbi:MAG TPA: RnfABCDGE type electron transport complex subunit D [Myxococcales bacterium]
MRLPKDARWLQIAFLASFLTLGLTARDFPLWHAPLIFAACLGTQLACEKLLKLKPAGLLSPLITSFGLTLLLRAGAWWVPVVAGVLAIGSKFVLRIRGRHFFNPANFGLCCVMLLTPRAWCSPTQWGEGAILLLWILALGCAVAHRAFRSDVSLAFLGSWILLRAARVLYLGQRAPVLIHQLAQGSLLLFTFFMISDPKTTPRDRASRIGFAAIVACVAFELQLRFVQNPIVWALFICAPLTPLFDLLTEEKAPCALPQSLLSPSP